MIFFWFSEQLAAVQFWNVLCSRAARIFSLSDALLPAVVLVPDAIPSQEAGV